MERDLIDAYLVELRRTLAGRRDVDDVVDEVADHLRENVSRLVSRGAAETEAQRRTLECFGELGVVARAFVETTSGELAVPTRLTRLAGTLGLAAAAAWVLSTVVGAADGQLVQYGLWSRERVLLFAIVTAVAAGLSTLTVLGALRRAGVLLTVTGAVCTVLTVAATLLVLLLPWATPLLMPVFGVGVVAGCLRARTPPRLRRPLLALAGVWLVGIVVLYLGNEVSLLGPTDDVGRHERVWLTVTMGTALGSALALLVTGRRLRAERAVDLDGAPPVVPLAG